jgi:hypothetical protein
MTDHTVISIMPMTPIACDNLDRRPLTDAFFVIIDIVVATVRT